MYLNTEAYLYVITFNKNTQTGQAVVYYSSRTLCTKTIDRFLDVPDSLSSYPDRVSFLELTHSVQLNHRYQYSYLHDFDHIASKAINETPQNARMPILTLFLLIFTVKG